MGGQMTALFGAAPLGRNHCSFSGLLALGGLLAAVRWCPLHRRNSCAVEVRTAASRRPALGQRRLAAKIQPAGPLANASGVGGQNIATVLANEPAVMTALIPQPGAKPTPAATTAPTRVRGVTPKPSATLASTPQLAMTPTPAAPMAATVMSSAASTPQPALANASGNDSENTATGNSADASGERQH